MENRIKQFMIVDLISFTIFSLITSLVGQGLANFSGGVSFQANFTLLLAVLIFVRWGFKGCFIFPLVTFLEFFVFSTNTTEIFINTIAAISINLVFIFFLKIRENDMKIKFKYVVGMITLCYVLFNVTKSILVVIIEGENLLSSIRVALAANLLTYFTALFVGYLLYSRSELFINVRKYFLEKWSESNV